MINVVDWSLWNEAKGGGTLSGTMSFDRCTLAIHIRRPSIHNGRGCIIRLLRPPISIPGIHRAHILSRTYSTKLAAGAVNVGVGVIPLLTSAGVDGPNIARSAVELNAVLRWGRRKGD